jgi:SAM-dependent methyltransferase
MHRKSHTLNSPNSERQDDPTAIAPWNPLWEEIFKNKEWGKYPPEHVVRFAAGNFYRVPDRSRVRLLEIGCGPGANLWFLAREGFSVAGIDGSATAIQRAQERMAREGLSADLRVGDFSTLGWPDASFDGAIENVSLYCNPWASIVKALAEVHRVLKPGAPFLSSFFSERTWGYGRGTMVEPDGFAEVTEGPLSGAGFCLFLRIERVEELFQHFDNICVERISRTAECERRFVEQLVITCRKPALY